MMNNAKMFFMIKALMTIANVVFPAICFVCGTRIKSDILCDDCAKKIKYLTPPLCRGCAKEMKGIELLCRYCRKKHLYYDRLISCVHYQEPIKTLVHLLKYRNCDYLIDFLSSIMIKYLSKIGFNPCGFDFITYVPSHPIRLREREYNQSFLLAKRISNFLKIPLKNDIILCKRNVGHQTRLIKAHRLKNIENNFYANDNLDNRNIILLDDIITTGATILECSRMLKEKGANSITVLTLARAQ